MIDASKTASTPRHRGVALATIIEERDKLPIIMEFEGNYYILQEEKPMRARCHEGLVLKVKEDK